MGAGRCCWNAIELTIIPAALYGWAGESERPPNPFQDLLHIMVYCGKPSKGCGQCRARKIRCDQARPVCSQCTRAKRDCPGYRDQLSLMFRDESKSVMRKAEAGSSMVSTTVHQRPGRSTRTASPDGNTASALTMSNSVELAPLIDFNSDPHLGSIGYLEQQQWQLPLEVQPSAEVSQQEAIAFFLQSRVALGTSWMSDFVVRLSMQTGGSTSTQAMQTSLAAVSLAMLGRVKRLPELKPLARKEYVSALTLLNKALTNSEQAKSNQTLGAVVLLAVYEVR